MAHIIESQLTPKMTEALEELRLLSILTGETFKHYSYDIADNRYAFEYITSNQNEIYYDCEHNKFNVYNLNYSNELVIGYDEYYTDFEKGFWRWVEIVREFVTKE